jgi:hypothetical protein
MNFCRRSLSGTELFHFIDGGYLTLVGLAVKGLKDGTAVPRLSLDKQLLSINFIATTHGFDPPVNYQISLHRYKLGAICKKVVMVDQAIPHSSGKLIGARLYNGGRLSVLPKEVLASMASFLSRLTATFLILPKIKAQS